MSGSRKPVTTKLPDGLSKENAKLTREIVQLEDALLLHQRYVDEDHNSVQGLIRQEVGGSRWQYGGGGKLHTFRSKEDLAETQGSVSHRNNSKSTGGSKKMEAKSQLEIVPAKSTGPKCLNGDAVIQSKSTTGESRKPSTKSKKSKTKSSHLQQASWSSGTRTLDPSSKEYDAFMQGVFGDGGFPLKKQYSVESAAVGMSLFAEKSETDIKEMKSKVLKRASAVLIMRPRSASAAEIKGLKSSPVPGNSKMAKSKAHKKLTGTQVDRKSVIACGRKKDIQAVQDVHNSASSNKNSSFTPSFKVTKLETDFGTYSSPVLFNTQSKEDSSKHEVVDKYEKDTDAQENAPVLETEDDSEDMSDVLALFNKTKVSKDKSQQQVVLSEHRYPTSSRSWDRNAVPKPWDKWTKVNCSDQDVDKSMNRSKQLAEGRSGLKTRMLNSQHSEVLKSDDKPPTGRSWTPSSHTTGMNQTKQPQSTAQQTQRHSWTGELATKSYQLPKSRKQAKSMILTTILPSSKQRAVADWLDKHVGQEEVYKPTTGSNSTICALPSSHTLADITAQAGGVDCFESDKQVAAWLSCLGLKNVDKYEELFTQHQIEMVDLPSLTVSVLEHMGINKVGPVMKIMRGVESLKAQVSKTKQKIDQAKDLSQDIHFGQDGKAGKTDCATEGITKGKDATNTLAKISMNKNSTLVSQSLKHCMDIKPEANRLSAAERAESFRSSLQELYRDLTVEKPSIQKLEENMSDNSRETSPFECTDFQHDGVYSESSSNMFNVNSELDIHKRQAVIGKSGNNSTSHHMNKVRTSKPSFDSSVGRNQTSMKHGEDTAKISVCTTGKEAHTRTNGQGDTETPTEWSSFVQTKRIPQGGCSKRSGRAARSNSSGSVKVTGKVKDQPSNGKVKNQGDGTQQRSASFRMDTGIDRLVQRLAERQKKRQQEEEMLEVRLQRLREQRNAMAARHKLRERSKSVERDGLPLLSVQDEAAMRKGRRKSDSGLDNTTTPYFESAGELVAGMAHSDTPFQGLEHASPRTDRTAHHVQEISHLMNGEDGSQLQNMTLSKVRRLQDKLHHLEKSMLLSTATNTSVTAAGAAAYPAEALQSVVPSGSLEDMGYEVDDLLSPGAEGATGGKIEVILKPRRRSMDNASPQRSGSRGGDFDMPSSNRQPQRRGQGLSSLSHQLASHRPLRKSRRVPVSHRASQHSSPSTAQSNTKRHVVMDHNDNCSAPPPISASSEKEPVIPKVVTLTFRDVMLRKEGDDNCPQKEEAGEGSGTKPQTTAAHMSMSKRQLLDEIRREKDEHRKNVRHLKSELTRLQHKDPVKKSEIDSADIEFTETELIGEGSFCQVFRGQFQGAEVAVKRLKTPLSSLDKNYFAAEVSLLQDLRHPRVVLLVGVSTADRLPIMVLEYMAGRDLYSLIHNPSRVSLDHAEFYQIARDISSGMVYLHNHRPLVLHLDLKSMNVLLTSSHRAKIADFGFSKLKHDADKKGGKPAKNKEVKGSPAWMAPELLQGGEVTPKADVFSFGIILWEMTSRKHPYEGCSVYEILERVRMDRRPEIPESCPSDLSALIVRCWSPNPAVRPNFKDVLQQVEDLSFPPGWRALFKAAGVPNEALEDVTSTRHIISLVSSSLETSTLNAAQESADAVFEKRQKNQEPQKRAGERTSLKKGGDLLIRDSLETYDYSLSDEETLHLEDSLNTTLQNDSLEEVSLPSRSSCNATLAETLQNGQDSYGGRHTESQTHIPAETKRTSDSSSSQTVLNNLVKTFDVPLLPLDSLRSPTPQAVQLSMSSLYDSVEDGPAVSVQFPGHCTDQPTKSNTPGRNLTPIVPHLALDKMSNTDEKTVISSEEAIALPAVSLGRHSTLAPITAQPKPGADDSEESTDLQGKSATASSAQRLGLSHRLSFCSEEPYTSSPRESNAKGFIKENSAGRQTKLLQGVEHTCLIPETCSPQNLQTSQKEFVSYPNGENTDAPTLTNPNKSVLMKPVPCAPKPKERTKLSARPSSSELTHKTESNKNECKKGLREQTLSTPKSNVSAKTGPSSQDTDCHCPSPSSTGELPHVRLPPPPPPPPPPAPVFTPSGPHFSNSQTATEELEQRTQTLASVHQELLQFSRNRLYGSTEVRASKKKCKFLKERYRGNPHISVEASALLEQKGQLKSATQPHPSQLKDVPASGQVFTCMADLLRKAMEDRRFAMGENLTTSNSQEMTDVSWSLQDD